MRFWRCPRKTRTPYLGYGEKIENDPLQKSPSKDKGDKVDGSNQSHSTPYCQHITVPRGGSAASSQNVGLFSVGRREILPLRASPYAMSSVLLAVALAFRNLPQRFTVRTAPSVTLGLTPHISQEGVYPAQLHMPLRVAAESYAVPDEQ